MTDTELIRRAVKGDREAFGALARRHFQAVWAAALAVTGERADAEDVAQEALVRAWRRLDQCRDPERFRTWLVRVTRNVALNWVAARSRRAGRQAPLAEHASTDPSPFEAVRRDELGRTLLSAAGELTEMQRTVLLLYDLEGLSHREIADALGVTSASSRRHLSDARRRMRSLLEAAMVNEEEGP